MFRHADLEKLRAGATADQREMIARVWDYYVKTGEHISTKVLHHALGKQTVISAAKALGGDVIQEVHETGKTRYAITLLGVLIGNQGATAEALLVRFLEYVRERYNSDPEVDSINDSELIDALALSSGETNDLKYILDLISLIRFRNNSGGWTAGTPRDVDDLPGIQDFKEYICTCLVRTYDPTTPVTYIERAQYWAQEQTALRSKHFPPDKTDDTPAIEEDNALDFSFVKDQRLQNLLNSDWIEATTVFKVGAWKSCVLLCGGVLEGALLSVLKDCEAAACEAYKCLKGRGKALALEKWDLIDLIDVSKELHIIKKGPGYLGHAIREFRNLIHPGKQLRENIEVTREEASIAISAVKICIWNLAI